MYVYDSISSNSELKLKTPPSLAPNYQTYKGSNFSDVARMVTSFDESSKNDEEINQRNKYYSNQKQDKRINNG